MPLLDRFRPKTPDWQHPDAAVRAAAVRQLGADEQALLLAMAREDADAQVRRAAVKRLSDAAALAEVARGDPDAQVREEAQALLLRIVLEARETPAGEAALAALADTKHLIAVARGARLPSLRDSALSRLADAKALALVARTADDSATRLHALQRIEEAGLIADVARKCEHKDTALAALERVGDPEALKAIAARGRHKAVSRRARGMLEARAGAPLALTREERRSRQLQLCRGLESLASSSDWARVSREVAAAEGAWADAGADADDALRRRFSAACAALRERLARFDVPRADAERRAGEVARGLAARAALCERVEALSGESCQPGLQEAIAEWERLEPLPGAEGEALALRFERSSAACRSRHEEWAAGAARRGRLQEICRELEALAGAAEPAEAAAQASSLRKEAARLRPTAAAHEPLLARLDEALRRLEALQSAAREERARREADNLARLRALAERLERLSKAPSLSLSDAERALRESRAALEDPGPLPSKREREGLTARLAAGRRALYPRVLELRESEDWRRWANLSVEEELCRKAEALLAEADVEKAVRELREIQARWKQAREVPKAKGEALWHRFKAARDQVQARAAEHFARKARLEAESLARKQALCERAEALAESTEWLKAAEELKRLQAEWKAIGPAPRRQANAVWERFHRACDRFFTRRKQDLHRRKDEWTKNLALKEALCAQAEALASSTEWDKAVSEVKRLQAEWKAIGPVRKSKSDSVWQRFRKACDEVFDRYKKRGELERAANVAVREAVCADIEALCAAPEGEPAPDDLAARVQAFALRWRRAPPVPREQEEGLERRFSSARDRLVERWPQSFQGTELDPEANRQKMDKLCARVEALVPRTAPPASASPGQALASRLREALATNTMGGRGAAEARWRAATEDVEAAQAAWKRIGPVPGDAGRALQERFQKACSRFYAERPRLSR